MRHIQGPVGTTVEVKVYKNCDMNNPRAERLEHTLNPEDTSGSCLLAAFLAGGSACVRRLQAGSVYRVGSDAGSYNDGTMRLQDGARRWPGPVLVHGSALWIFALELVLQMRQAT